MLQFYSYMKGGKTKMAKMMMKGDMQKHHKMWSFKMLVIGLIVLANAYYAFIGWDYLIGGLLVLAGLIKLAKPCC